MKRAVKYERQDWVLAWTDAHGPMNILDKDLVDAFTAKFNVRYLVQPFGANGCPILSRLLGSMYRCNLLDRGRISLYEGRGWPKWVYTYTRKGWKP